MKSIINCSSFMIKKYLKSGILPLVILMPFLALASINVIKNYVEDLVNQYIGLIVVILSLIAPVSLMFLSSMTILTEKEDGIKTTLTITLGGNIFYVLSKIGAIAILSLLIDLIVLNNYLSLIENIIISFSAINTSIALSLITVSFSNNRMEGMAITKLSGLIVIVALVPYFADKNIWWVVSIFTPFWLSLSLINNNLYFLFISLALSYIWVFVVYCIYENKSNNNN